MKNYMFYTTDGYTQDTNLNETENCQLLGFASGQNINEAYNSLIKDNNYILEHHWQNVTGYEVIGKPINI